jgi:uncharacterized membrane protein (UPF0127 family)
MQSSPPIAALNRSRGTCLAENVQIARTHWARLRGLIGTTASSFLPGQALWIVPSRGVHTLAMRFPLDLVYLDRLNKVIDLQEGMEPWRFAPINFAAASVLELPKGTIRRTGTTRGDKIEIVTAKQPEELAA